MLAIKRHDHESRQVFARTLQEFSFVARKVRDEDLDATYRDEEIMVVNIKDTMQSWDLDARGVWRRVAPSGKQGARKRVSAHDYFMTNPSLSGRGRSVKNLPRAFDHVGPRR